MLLHANRLPTIHSYDRALELWQRTQPWRDSQGEHDERPLSFDRKRFKTIRVCRDGSIALRYHNTDVVTYHKDGSLSLHAWSSQSTDVFANELTPYGIHTKFHGYGQYLVALQVAEGPGNPWRNSDAWRVYALRDNTITIAPEGDYWRVLNLETMTEPLERYRLDKRKANAILRQSKYPDFAAWLRAANAMGMPHDREYGTYLDRRDLVEQLDLGVQGWKKIHNHVASTTDGVLNRVRMALYHGHDCVVVEELPHANSFRHVSQLAASRGLYKW